MSTSQANKIITSIYGRRVGLRRIETAESGALVPVEFLVGQDLIGVQDVLSTAPSTAINEPPTGVSVLIGTSAASTPVYTLSPPIPGLTKKIVFGSTDSAIYLKMASGVAIAGTSLATTGATVIRSSGGGAMQLLGLTTALYQALGVSSSAVNAMEFQATT